MCEVAPACVTAAAASRKAVSLDTGSREHDVQTKSTTTPDTSTQLFFKQYQAKADTGRNA